MLEDKTIDDLKAEMTARRRKLNEELKSIPYRIDELSRENDEIDVKALTEEKKELEGKLNEIKNSKGIDYNFRIRAINGGIESLKNRTKLLEQELTKELRQQLDTAMEEGSKLKKDYYQAKSELEENTLKINKLEKAIPALNERVEELRDKFKEIAATEFDESSTICPACKQPLPTERIEIHIQEFEDNKKQTLQLINDEGKATKQDLIKAQKELEELLPSQKVIEKTVKELKSKIDTKANEVKTIEQKIAKADITSTPEYKEIQSKLVELNTEKKEILKLAEQQDNSKQVLELETKIAAINKELARVDLVKENEKRIEELKSRERKLAQMVAQTEKIEFLCEQYIIKKAELLEDKLNSRFETVKFKLFDIQVNGGINETFVTTVNGVPFEDLNNAMKINAGLDIINTLTDYYNFKAPIFIDNRESVNEIVDVRSQVINLIVSKDKKLRVEVI